MTDSIKIVNVEHASLDEHGMHIKVTAKLQLDLRDLQQRLRGAGPVTGVDPVDMQCTALLPELLKEHMDLSPFKIESVELYAVTQTESILGITVLINPRNEIRELPNLMSKYEALIVEKLIDPMETGA